MQNLLSSAFIEISTSGGRPALVIFGFPIYFYAIIIVSGMALAIFLSSRMFKKRGIDPYEITDYALVVLPFGILGARLYVYFFPWAGRVMDWSTFFDFRSGGLGIYGAIILGYLAGWVLCKIKKQDWWLVADCALGNVMLAQAIGRWGNFVNGEAYGQLITNPSLQFFPIAVQVGENWYQATFFYESFFNFIGFLICFLVLFNHKNYKKGWIASFYGLFYGTLRLIVEGMRSDSLFIYIGTEQTNIKISQLVSVFCIIMAIWRLSVIYRKQIHAFYSKLFSTEQEEVKKSTIYLALFTAIMFVLSLFLFIQALPLKASNSLQFICALASTALTVYCGLGVASLLDRQKLYCNDCGERLSLCEDEKFVCSKCGSTGKVHLNKFLLKIFPFKVYPDFSVDGLKEWVDETKIKKGDANE